MYSAHGDASFWFAFFNRVSAKERQSLLAKTAPAESASEALGKKRWIDARSFAV
jgi:hypothetical protein